MKTEAKKAGKSKPKAESDVIDSLGSDSDDEDINAEELLRKYGLNLDDGTRTQLPLHRLQLLLWCLVPGGDCRCQACSMASETTGRSQEKCSLLVRFALITVESLPVRKCSCALSGRRDW